MPPHTTDSLSLNHTEIPFQFQDQTGVPFWDRPACPGPLYPDFCEFSPGEQLYVVMDGATRQQHLGANDLETYQETLSAAPFFTTGTARDEYGPWLLALGVEGRIRARFLESMFSREAAPLTGIFLKTHASYSELRSHLRGLTKVCPDPDSDPSIFLRFWDPRTTAALFKANLHRSEFIERLCHTRSGTPIIWYAATAHDRMHRFAPTGKVTALRSRSPLILEPRDRAALNDVGFAALGSVIGNWLSGSYPNLSDIGHAAQERIGQHVVTIGRQHRFTLKDEFSQLAHLMHYLGGWFGQTNIFPEIDAVLKTQGTGRHRAMQGVFAEAWLRSHLPAMLRARQDILDDPLLQGDGLPQIDETELSPLLARHIADSDMPAVARMSRLVEADTTSRRAPSALVPLITLISLFLGYRFFDDPFRGATPGAARDWHATSRQGWEMLRSFDYA
ncbi:DUF4123 domain-containing protein [Paracoccus onubensis]|uniref:DUF4123 domain-containing protein n=1 Tax=Paracoccus onubensis TaxID=1675788 RepID=UPI001602ED0D|nr:DUF4123 domain-containing protein [Paracoccus onubensis]